MFVDRASHSMNIAGKALADQDQGSDSEVKRFIRREPLGIVLVLTPWNFPYITAVNAIVPALLAGNAVLFKPSQQTPMTGERIVEAFKSAGLPEGVLQVVSTVVCDGAALCGYVDTRKLIIDQ